MDETSKTFIKWEKFLRKNPSLTNAYEADPNICAQLLANQEEFEKETILDVAKTLRRKGKRRNDNSICSILQTNRWWQGIDKIL